MREQQRDQSILLEGNRSIRHLIERRCMLLVRRFGSIFNVICG
jgi:hypothetical protein